VPFFISHASRKAEERRQMREIGLKIGLAEYDRTFAIRSKQAEAGQRVVIPPIYVCVLHGIRVSEIIFDKGLTANEMENRVFKTQSNSGGVQDAQ
jgi:hypothetical protein